MKPSHDRLLLDHDGLSAWHCRNGQLSKLASFPANEAGHEQFSRFLAVDRHRCHRLLVNLPDEAFSNDTLPDLPRREARELLVRRRARLFPDTPWQTSLPAGKHSVLHLALTNPPALEPWLARLAGYRLQGIHTLPQLLPALLPVRQDSINLVLSQHGTSIRLTLIDENRQLRHSQLVPHVSPERLGEHCRSFLDHPEVRARMPPGSHCRQTLIATPGFRDALPMLTVDNFIPSLSAEAAELALRLPERHWPGEQLAPDALRRTAREARLGRRLYAAAGAAAVAGLLALAFQGWQASDIQARQSELESRAQTLRNERQALSPMAAGFSGDPATSREIVRDYPRLQALATSYRHAIHRLSLALDRLPAIVIDELDWENPLPVALTASSAKLVVHGRIEAHDGAEARRVLTVLSTALAPGFEAGPIALPDTPSDTGHRFILTFFQRQP